MMTSDERRWAMNLSQMPVTGQAHLTGVAVPRDPAGMLDEICEHFIEHASVERTGDAAQLKNDKGVVGIRIDNGRLLIDLTCPSDEDLQVTRTILAEHLFYFAGDEGLDLDWSTPAAPLPLPDLVEVTVVGAEDVTPHMRRVRLACRDVTPYLHGDMHVRVLVPPRGRTPVWPTLRPDGRIGWPEGDDALVVRVYTIRAVDVARNEISIDILQHPAAGVPTPGADFARDAEPGQVVALLAPGAGHVPEADEIFLAGDESALPAIARIIEEAPAGTRIRAIIEVANVAEEQPLRSAAALDVQWLHRDAEAITERTPLLGAVTKALETLGEGTYIWVAGERQDIRTIRSILRKRGHPRKRMYVAWYWDRQA
jgi:NADPH-dependent ferric siderophore reductase